MKWSMDTHKYISDVTRKALQIMVTHGINSASSQEEIDVVERELGASGVYKDYEGAQGRVRRALFTYFKAYGCLDEDENLTEIGALYAENRISIREFSFYYILNYLYENDEVRYYPAHLLSKFMQLIHGIAPEQSYMTPYDFSRIVECDSIDDITREFVEEVLSVRNGETIVVNERNIGFDVWAKMLVQAGILKRNEEKNLEVNNYELLDWIIYSYEQNPTTEKGKIRTGVLSYLPIFHLMEPVRDIATYVNEGKAIQAFLFDSVDDYTIDKYIYSLADGTFGKLREDLGLSREQNRGFYKAFIGLERLVGFVLAKNANLDIKNIGEIIASVDLSSSELNAVSEDTTASDNNQIEYGCNILFYGVPGSGKSYAINKICSDETYMERVVFHPDYSYSDFIGQILPRLVEEEGKEDKKMTYEFVAGPFTNVLSKAINDSEHMYYLIIEEINRGNAPAIFGEIFQLLDRKETGKVGESEYSIVNYDIADYIYGDTNERIRIPSNLTLLATMNTSDQNVFTLDTAFQRRWDMRHIPNKFTDSHACDMIEGTVISWGVFAGVVNDLVIEMNSDMTGSGDKRLGAYFAKTSELRREVFSEKVLKYLWDDAFRMDKQMIFDKRHTSLEKILDAYQNATEDALKSVLKGDVYQKMSDGMRHKEVITEMELAAVADEDTNEE